MAHWRRNFNIFLGGQFQSGITSMVVQYAIIWYLTMQTGSATVLSVATLLGMLPMIALSPFVGGVVDRLNKKMLLIVSDAVVALFAIILSIAGGFSTTFPLWLVFVSLFMRSLAQTFQQPTIQAALPTMVPMSEVTRTNGQLGMIQSANYIISPALGAALYSVVPIRWLILVDVLGFVIGAGLLLLVQIPHTKKAHSGTHPLQDARFGLLTLRSRQGLWVMALVGTVFTLFFMPLGAMSPLMTVQYFHGTVAQAGLVEVVWSVVMLVGGAIIGVRKTWQDRMRPAIAAFFVVGISVSVMAFLPGNTMGFWWFVALNTLVGLAVPFFSTMVMALSQESFPPDALGRVMGVFNSLMSLGGPVGLIAAGPLGDAVGVQNLFLFGGLGSIVCGLLVVTNEPTRHYDLTLRQEKLNE